MRASRATCRWIQEVLLAAYASTAASAHENPQRHSLMWLTRARESSPSTKLSERQDGLAPEESFNFGMQHRAPRTEAPRHLYGTALAILRSTTSQYNK